MDPPLLLRPVRRPSSPRFDECPNEALEILTSGENAEAPKNAKDFSGATLQMLESWKIVGPIQFI